MKKILVASMLLFSLLFSASADAQKLKDWVEAKKKEVKEKADAKINQKTSAAMDSAVNTPESLLRKKKEKKAANKAKTLPANNNSTNSTNSTNSNSSQENSTAENSNETSNGKKAATLKFYSKFDFIPGENIVAIEDFSQDALGDFPARWNTNSGADLVNVEGKTGIWLSLSKNGVFMPEFFKSFPENFTLQFELMCNPDYSFYTDPLGLAFVKLSNPKKFTDWTKFNLKDRNGSVFSFFPANAGVYDKVGSVLYEIFENGTSTMQNEITTAQFFRETSNYAKVSVWRQKQRIRIYLNEEKVLDLPRGMTLSAYNALVFTTGGFQQSQDRFLISNIKLAVGAPDTRNKLITEGKFVTRGILFDINSDKIKPESYGAIKDIATVLKENTDVKVKIIGHTDSDGDDNGNLELSKRRAGAIKTTLATDFGIDASRLQTDGKGETQPVDKNNTPEGKANNRRVEFIKT